MRCQGKTVQISTFLGNIVEKFKAWPALVIVPNSTITNWVRELARWAPNLRVVPFYGEGKARDVVREFELNHARVQKGTTGAKFHVLVTTYETLITPKELTAVFKRTPRWEVLIVDEGQRCKSSGSFMISNLSHCFFNSEKRQQLVIQKTERAQYGPSNHHDRGTYYFILHLLN
jgi:chromodomain-helicase-DNA-binding protein 4